MQNYKHFYYLIITNYFIFTKIFIFSEYVDGVKK